MIAEVSNIKRAGAHRPEIKKLVALEWAKDVDALLNISDKFRYSCWVGKGGVGRNEGLKALINFAALHPEKEGFELLLDSGGRGLGVRVTREELGNERRDFGQVGRTGFIRRGGPSRGQGKGEEENKEGWVHEIIFWRC